MLASNFFSQWDHFWKKQAMGTRFVKAAGGCWNTRTYVLFCRKAEMIWKLAPIQWDGIKQYRHDFWRWWEHLLEAGKRNEGREHTALTINHVWSKLQWENKRYRVVVDRPLKEWNEYISITVLKDDKEGDMNFEHQTRIGKNSPRHGVIKINTDAACDQRDNRLEWDL